MTTQDSALAARFGRLSAIGNSPTMAEAAASIQQFAEEDSWAQPHARMLAAGSPTSAALAWELQARLRFRSLADVFRAEYAVALGCCAHGDFAEGIRALIVDKDRAPRWKPSRLDQITAELIEDLLRPNWSGPHPLADLGQSLAGS
jgi:enoyl-CoA hydratase/carnithine racemase